MEFTLRFCEFGRVSVEAWPLVSACAKKIESHDQPIECVAYFIDVVQHSYSIGSLCWGWGHQKPSLLGSCKRLMIHALSRERYGN